MKVAGDHHDRQATATRIRDVGFALNNICKYNSYVSNT
jgi:hypothetical protein